MSALAPQTQLHRNIVVSIVLHGFILSIGLIYGALFPGKPISIGPSIQVDLVGLPDKKVSTPNQSVDTSLADLTAKLKPKPPVETKTHAPVRPLQSESSFVRDKSKRTKALQAALDRVKALEKIERTVGKNTRKGNILSSGTSATGEVSTDATAETALFVANLRDRLRNNWNLPAWLLKQKLSAQAVIVLDAAGFIRTASLVTSSGNDQFDAQALQTIRVSQPFGRPPPELVLQSIKLGFPL